jgi:hypothetical protein
MGWGRAWSSCYSKHTQPPSLVVLTTQDTASACIASACCPIDASFSVVVLRSSCARWWFGYPHNNGTPEALTTGVTEINLCTS